MKANKKVPKVRFPGFTDDWEQRKLGELIDVCSGRDYKHLSEGTIPVYGTGGYMLSVSEALSYNEDAIGIGRKGTIDKPYILKAPFWTVDTLFYAIPREKIDLNFVFDVFQNIDWKKKDESTGVPSLSKTAINDIDVLAPGYDEQQVIGQFFAKIDNLITLQQRKIDSLKEYKKGMLQNMFPQKGKTVPKVRFPEFTEDWEQRKLGEFGKATGGTSIESEFVEEGNYRVINIGSYSETNIYNDQGLRTNKTPKTENKILNKGDLTMILNDKTAAGNIIGRVLLIDADNSYVYNQRTERIEVYKEEFEPSFLYQLLNAENIRSKIIKASQGNTQIYVNWSAISELKYPIPKVKSEQKKIATFFNSLDTLITLQQRKIDELKEFKKGMLQNMFV